MTSTYVLLLVFFLSGGPILTETITAPSIDDCHYAEHSERELYMKNGTYMHHHHYDIKSITSVCMKVEEQENR